MNLEDHVLQTLDRLAVQPGQHLLVAFSGGPDSLALLLALKSLERFRLTAAHVNHRLRGVESDDDESFARSTCLRLGVDFIVCDGLLPEDLVRRVGIEAAAREVRYAKLSEAAEESDAGFIVTAHHRDDAIETILMKLISGGGLHRIRGIREHRGKILRPFLGVTRALIEEYLSAHSASSRHDSSNESRRFLRNRIRHDVLPLLRTINPKVEEALLRTVREAAAFDDILLRLVRAARAAAVTDDAPAMVRFNVASLPHELLLLRELLRSEISRLDPAGAREISSDDLDRIVGTIGRRQRINLTQHLMLDGDEERLVLSIARLDPPARPFCLSVFIDGTAEVREIGALVRIRRLEKAVEPFATEDHLTQAVAVPSDCSVLELRNRRRGDRFQPLGSANEKKLNRFLIDRRIPQRVRDRLPLLTCDGEIAWIAGVEVSEKYKVTAEAANVIEISIEYLNA